MALALAQILPRFGTVETGARRLPEVARPVEDLIAEAERRGRTEAAATHLAEIETLRAQAEADFALRLESARQLWAETESVRLAEALTSAVAELDKRLASSVARILAPFLSAGARKRALSELAEKIAELRADGGEPLMRVSGPKDLLDQLRGLPAAVTIAAEFVVNSTVEVTVTVDETAIETQLAGWSARLAEALADG